MEELYERRRNLQKRIDSFFGDDEGNVHYGDRGYQDLLESMVVVEMEINDSERDEMIDELTNESQTI
jgi:hypothetical protein